MESHFTPADLAKRERVSLETVYYWNRSGTGPRYLRIGRHVRYSIAEVLAWEASRLVSRGSATA
jgi:predicted DNA-binding transcriptional regulator AlpA